MKKLFLLLDEWDNDRNFVGRELKLIKEKYDVTVICNSASVMLDPDVRYSVYIRPPRITAVSNALKMLLDPDAWEEIRRVLRDRPRSFAKLSEVIRFYINADLFRSFMKRNGFLQDNAIYYSYWYFWKCYAVTHEIDKYQGSRIITRTHEYDLYDYTSPSGYQPFKEAMDRKLDSVVFIAEHGMEYYLSKYRRKKCDKYKLYYLGTQDPVKYDPKGDYTGEDGESVCMQDDVPSFLLVSCSSIIERKRVDRIAEALSMIDEISIQWVHFGTGDKEAELKKICENRLKGKSNIRYELKGYVRNDELHKFYRNNKVDAFITASSSEGNPVSVMEAMSYGIPVIAPAICNFPNMIKDCGILVSDECGVEELSEAIRRTAEMDEASVEELRCNSRKCWEERFDSDKNDRRFVEEVLDKL